MNYYDILHQDEQEKINKLEEQLRTRFCITDIERNDLIVCMCNSARIEELRLNPMTTFASPGDKLLDFVLYHAKVKLDPFISKGSLDNLRQKNTKKENQHKLMIELDLDKYILNGNCQSLYDYVKDSIHPISDQFEALIYVIFKNLGIKAVEKFLQQIDFI